MHGHDKAVDIVILVEDDFSIDQNGRTSCAKLILKWPHSSFPNEIPFEVITNHSIATEKDVDILAIASRGRRCRASGRMDRFKGLGRQSAFPAYRAALAIERVGCKLFGFTIESGDEDHATMNAGGRVPRRQLGLP